jgi:HKD family nuclease
VKLIGVINQPWNGVGKRVGDSLINLLGSSPSRFEEAWAVIAWTRRSGVSALKPSIDIFRAGGGSLRVVTGIDLHGTTSQGLEALLEVSDEAHVFHNTSPASTFHPKLFLFKGPAEAEAVIGSANLTASGLFLNSEANVHLQLDLADRDDRETFDDLMSIYQSPLATALTLTKQLIDDLMARGMVGDESLPRPKVTSKPSAPGAPTLPPLFPSIPVPAPPRVSAKGVSPVQTSSVSPTASVPTINTFLMKMGAFDAVRRSGHSPDILIPVAAREADPAFWDWPGAFTTGSSGYPERYVTLRIINPPHPPQIVNSRNYWYEGKHEFRLNCGAIQDAAGPDDIIQIEKKALGSPFDYDVTLVRAGDPAYASVLAQCTNAVVNSAKRWGYV